LVTSASWLVGAAGSCQNPGKLFKQEALHALPCGSIMSTTLLLNVSAVVLTGWCLVACDVLVAGQRRHSVNGLAQLCPASRGD
jgi:hypothetical protein